MKKITLNIKDSKELLSTLKKFSREHGGAWAFEIMPFSHETRFYQYKNPSSIPDYFIDLTRGMGGKGRIGYKGKIVSFTKAAQIREQNRGYTGDR